MAPGTRRVLPTGIKAKEVRPQMSPHVRFREGRPCRGSGDSSTAGDDIGHMRGSPTHTIPVKYKPRFFWKTSKESLAAVQGGLLSRREDPMKMSRALFWLRDARRAGASSRSAPSPGGRPSRSARGPWIPSSHRAERGRPARHPPSGSVRCQRSRRPRDSPGRKMLSRSPPTAGRHVPRAPPPLRCRDVSTPSAVHTASKRKRVTSESAQFPVRRHPKPRATRDAFPSTEATLSFSFFFYHVSFYWFEGTLDGILLFLYNVL